MCDKIIGEKVSVKLLIGILAIVGVVLLAIGGFQWAIYEKIASANTNTVIANKEIAEIKKHIEVNGIVIPPEADETTITTQDEADDS